MSGFWIRQPEDQGGIALGPFTSPTITLGSDARACQLILGAAHGVAATHARVGRDASGSFTIEPAGASASVFVWRGQRPDAARNLTRLREGEWFSLGDPRGPRFCCTQNAPAGAAPAGPAPTRSATGVPSLTLPSLSSAPRIGGGGVGGRFGAELSRVLRVQARRYPMIRTFDQLMYRFRSRSWQSPMFLVSVALAVFGALCGGGATLGTAIWRILDT